MKTKLCPPIYLWRIRKIRWKGSKGSPSEEFVTAPTINEVWEYLTPERYDEAVEIESINREVPVIRNINTTPE